MTLPHTPNAEKGPAQVQALVMQLAGADAFASALGITCTEAGLGHASVALSLQHKHLNFNGNCHGGVIFALADTAFGLASNSYGKVAAGIDAHITYQTAARLGERLTARATEVSRSRKLAVYRVDVNRTDGALISSFTGTVYLTQLDIALAAQASPQETI